ncbi:MAG TPA: response regulator [Pseudobdellovibrionaceae bacterium]|nr:response regulator [Pseudobdellovibrionaceae bacterium]
MKELLAKAGTILVVDDEPELLEIIEGNLSSSFADVLTATDGLEAIKILKTYAVDAVVTDYMMPNMDGLKLIEYISKNHPLLPVVMLTANGQNPEVLKALEHGAFDILDKPFRREVLVNRIENSLILPKLIEIVWMLLSADYPPEKLEAFLKMNRNEQLKIIYAYAQLLTTRGISGKGTFGKGGKGAA